MMRQQKYIFKNGGGGGGGGSERKEKGPPDREKTRVWDKCIEKISPLDGRFLVLLVSCLAGNSVVWRLVMFVLFPR